MTLVYEHAHACCGSAVHKALTVKICFKRDWRFRRRFVPNLSEYMSIIIYYFTGVRFEKIIVKIKCCRFLPDSVWATVYEQWFTKEHNTTIRHYCSPLEHYADIVCDVMVWWTCDQELAGWKSGCSTSLTTPCKLFKHIIIVIYKNRTRSTNIKHDIKHKTSHSFCRQAEQILTQICIKYQMPYLLFTPYHLM